MSCCVRVSWIRWATPLSLAAALALAPLTLHAGEAADDTTAALSAEPAAADGESFPARTAVRALIDKEVAKTRLPADVAEAVVFVESRYDSTVLGRDGEVGLMQVRPDVAAMLGFKGTTAELASPETNIHYGVAHLAAAWRLAEGDLCRALMRYRTGDSEDATSRRSAIYCNRVRNRLVAMDSQFAAPVVVATPQPDPAPASVRASAKPKAAKPARPSAVYATYKRGTPAASRAYWAAHEARIRAIKARIAAKSRRVASR